MAMAIIINDKKDSKKNAYMWIRENVQDNYKAVAGKEADERPKSLNSHVMIISCSQESDHDKNEERRKLGELVSGVSVKRQ